jgi:hypothetical protein
MDARMFVISETDRVRDEAVRLLKVVHSRLETLRRTGKSFGTLNLVETAREAKKGVRKVQGLLKPLPKNLGEAVTAGGIPVVAVQGDLPFQG